MDTLPASMPGFVWGYRFPEGGGKPTRLANNASQSDLTADGGFYWLHLNLADARVPSLLDSLSGLTDDAKAALITHDTHSAITVDEQMLYGTLVDCQREFDHETADLGWLHFAISDRFIITTRLQPLRSIDRARQLVEKNPAKFTRPVDLFELLVTEFQRTLIAIVMDLTEDLNAIEDFVYDPAPRDERRRLAPVRRTVVRIHRHLRTVLALMRRAAASDDDEMPFGFEDVAGRLTARLETVDHDIYVLQDRARLLHEEIDSKQSSETNRHLYILSIMTAFLLPPTLVTGFFGMNTANLPFTEGATGTEYAIVMIAASIMLAWFLLKRMKIL